MKRFILLLVALVVVIGSIPLGVGGAGVPVAYGQAATATPDAAQEFFSSLAVGCSEFQQVGGYSCAKAYDRVYPDSGEGNSAAMGNNNTQWWQIQVSSARVLGRYRLYSNTANQTGLTYVVSGSTNGSTWTTIPIVAGSCTLTGAWYDCSLNNASAYTYYKFQFDTCSGCGYWRITEIYGYSSAAATSTPTATITNTPTATPPGNPAPDPNNICTGPWQYRHVPASSTWSETNAFRTMYCVYATFHGDSTSYAYEKGGSPWGSGASQPATSERFANGLGSYYNVGCTPGYGTCQDNWILALGDPATDLYGDVWFIPYTNQPNPYATATPGGPTATLTPTRTSTPIPGQPTNTPVVVQPTNTPIPGQPTNTPFTTSCTPGPVAAAAMTILSNRLINGCGYCWGSRDPTVQHGGQWCPTGYGLDCSGAGIWAYRQAGLNMADGTADSLYRRYPHTGCTLRQNAESLACWQVGDFAVLCCEGGSIYHVAWYAGGGIWNDCYNTATGCIRHDIRDWNDYQRDFAGAGRVVSDGSIGQCGGTGGGGSPPTATAVTASGQATVIGILGGGISGVNGTSTGLGGVVNTTGAYWGSSGPNSPTSPSSVNFLRWEQTDFGCLPQLPIVNTTLCMKYNEIKEVNFANVAAFPLWPFSAGLFLFLVRILLKKM